MNGDWFRAVDISKSFDGVHALVEFSCALGPGSILGLVGPNGAGKTTFFDIVTGALTPDDGRVVFLNRQLTGLPPHSIARAGIARTFQDSRLIRGLTVLDNVLLHFPHQREGNVFDVLVAPRRQVKREDRNRQAALELLQKVGLGGPPERPAEALSFGEQKLLTMTCCLASGAELLLLDEPISGLAPTLARSVLYQVRQLAELGKSVIVIEHNLEAMAEACDRLIVLENGRTIAEGSPDEVRDDPRVRNVNPRDS